MGLYRGNLKLYSYLMTEDDLHQLLLTRLQQQGIEPVGLPLFLHDLVAILKMKPEPSVSVLNERLNVLGWHQVQLDYQSLQLALAWVETEARNSSS
jgi:hypothetical protein